MNKCSFTYDHIPENFLQRSKFKETLWKLEFQKKVKKMVSQEIQIKSHIQLDLTNSNLKEFQTQNWNSDHKIQFQPHKIRIHKIWAPLFCHPNWKIHMWEYQGGRGVLVFFKTLHKMQSRREVNLILRTAKFVTDLNYTWLHFERIMKKK